MSTGARSMTAAVYYGAGDVRVEQRPLPVRGVGEALIRVLRSGMCGTDASEWRSGPRVFAVGNPHQVTGHSGPMILGHEFVGEIAEADAGSGYLAGDLVACGAGISCGECPRCTEGRTNLCLRYRTLGLSMDGAMAQYVSAPTSTLSRIPAGLAIDRAALAQPLAVGLHAARRSRARSGDRVVVIGAGAIGAFVLAALLSLADVTVTVVDFAGDRLDRATALGAHHTVAAGPDVPADVLALVGADGADVVIEASGASGQLSRALELVRRGGVILQVGLPSQDQSLDIHRLVMSEITIETTLAHVCGDDLGAALDILASTDLAGHLLQGVYPLSDVATQLERLATGEIHGKVLFDPTLA